MEVKSETSALASLEKFIPHSVSLAGLNFLKISAPTQKAISLGLINLIFPATHKPAGIIQFSFPPRWWYPFKAQITRSAYLPDWRPAWLSWAAATADADADAGAEE